MEKTMADKVKMRTLAPEISSPEKKSLLWPIVGVFVFGFGLFWAGTHIAGGCTDTLEQAVTYCPIN
jgi:hypothetical protein